MVKQKIPKKIHQIWIGPKKMPNNYKIWTETWKKYNPSWHYKLWTEKDLNILYEKIYKLGYSRVLVETGLTFLNFLLTNKALNELYIFKSENKLGKNGNNNDTSKYIKKIFSKLPLINIHNDQLVKKRFNNV